MMLTIIHSSMYFEVIWSLSIHLHWINRDEKYTEYNSRRIHWESVYMKMYTGQQKEPNDKKGTKMLRFVFFSYKI